MMHLPSSLVVAILQMAFEDLEYMLMDAEAYGDPSFIDEVYSHWRAVDEVLYELRYHTSR